MDDYQNNPLNEVDGMPGQPSYPSQNFGTDAGNTSGSYTYNYEEQNTQNNGSQPGKVCSIISLVLGILGIVLCCTTGLNLVLSIAAIVLAVVSRKQRGSFNGLAIAGLVCGIVGTVLSLIVIIFAVLSVIGAAQSPELYDYIYSLT